ncbi:MAG TPA: hypothetical protein VEK07_11085 [Polyangiaceae bacterium]|nr:hypothetical protein [Polyangiaceae bacterium]
MASATTDASLLLFADPAPLNPTLHAAATQATVPTPEVANKSLLGQAIRHH